MPTILYDPPPSPRNQIYTAVLPMPPMSPKTHRMQPSNAKIVYMEMYSNPRSSFFLSSTIKTSARHHSQLEWSYRGFVRITNWRITLVPHRFSQCAVVGGSHLSWNLHRKIMSESNKKRENPPFLSEGDIVRVLDPWRAIYFWFWVEP